MNRPKTFLLPLIIVSMLSVSQGALLHKRDTLNILSTFGREVSFSAPDKFKVDSINPGIGVYPCSLSHTGIFFVSLGNFPACPKNLGTVVF